MYVISDSFISKMFQKEICNVLLQGIFLVNRSILLQKTYTMTKFVSKLCSFVLGKRYTKFCISHCFFIFNKTCQLMSQNSLTVLNIDVQTLTPLPKVIQKYNLFVPSIFNLTTRYHTINKNRT